VTLRQLLVARLDRLSTSARDTLQLAAVLGREFRQDLLRAIASKDEWTLREDLRELCDSRLLYARRSTAIESFVFKHALVRDAAYDSMMRVARQDVHARVAVALREHAAEVVEQQPELLAQHLEAAGQTAAAVEYWQRAGDRALRRAAYAEAAQHLTRGLEATARLRESDERARLEVELLTSYGTVLFSTQGYAAPEVEATFARAQTLCERLGRAADRKVVDRKVLSGIVGVHIIRGNRDATERLLPQFERLIEQTDDVVALVTGYSALGITAFWRGDHVRAGDYLERAREPYFTEDFARYARGYGYDGGIFSCAYRAWNLWVLGYAERAEAAYAELQELAARSFDPLSLPMALAFGLALAYCRRDADETEARSLRLVEVATEQKFYAWLFFASFGRGGAATLRGRAEEGIAQIQQGLAIARTFGAMTVYGQHLTFLAAAQCAAERFDDGLAVIDEALGLSRHALARYHEPELYRLRGVMLRHRGERAAAEAALREAVTLAERGGARAWQLRAATSLADLLREDGREVEARAQLVEIYATFTEGFDSPDLQDARALLARFDAHR
jgi:tetratricopeptide (TPR) repeat protein